MDALNMCTRDSFPARSCEHGPEQLTASELALSRREAIRRRARRIRRAVAALAGSLFSAAFLFVYVQMASGHDPALSASADKRAAAANSAEPSSAGSSESSSAGSSESSTSASAVTTSQS